MPVWGLPLALWCREPRELASVALVGLNISPCVQAGYAFLPCVSMPSNGFRFNISVPCNCTCSVPEVWSGLAAQLDLSAHDSHTCLSLVALPAASASIQPNLRCWIHHGGWIPLPQPLCRPCPAAARISHSLPSRPALLPLPGAVHQRRGQTGQLRDPGSDEVSLWTTVGLPLAHGAELAVAGVVPRACQWCGRGRGQQQW